MSTSAVRAQSLGEEVANAVTHGAGFLLAVASLPVLVSHAMAHGDAATVVGASLFSATMIVLYLVSTLYHFDASGANDFSVLFGLPNIVRRFLEAFGGIMIPISKGLKTKMDRLFTDAVERERVWKFINHYSHNTSVTRSVTIPDMSECQAVVQACLKAVKSWDADYFNDLKAEVA